jgi:hypothetical protein
MLRSPGVNFLAAALELRTSDATRIEPARIRLAITNRLAPLR